MPTATKLTGRGSVALVLALSLSGCGKMKQIDPQEASKGRTEAKRRQAACASSNAYNRLKSIVFDQAIGAHGAAWGSMRTNLDTLADYSLARMDDPVVTGWDSALDITRCKGRLILQVPPGAERGFQGESRLQTDVVYTAQAAADGNGFVYQLQGAEPIIAKLAAFKLASGAYRPPPAIDEEQTGPDASEPTDLAQADASERPSNAVSTRSSPADKQEATSLGRQRTYAPDRAYDRAPSDERNSAPASFDDASGEDTVRAFYHALGAGDGGAASAQIIPEKRSGRTYSPEAISRFYGRLAEPLRLINIVALARGTYRVSYRYSTGRSRCEGNAIVHIANRDGRELIRSINALNGC